MINDYSEPVPLCLRMRQAAAWPIYAVALIMDLMSAALGRLAAWVAADQWPA